MPTKSYKLRLDLRPNEPVVDRDRFTERTQEVATTQRLLDDTREAFNQGVDYLCGWLLKMHRGAGVWREKKDGIWRDWREISTFEQLHKARSAYRANPTTFALLENGELLEGFKDKGKSEAEAVELAECCRRIAKDLCPPSEDASNVQMPRSDFDLLTNCNSIAKGLRSAGDSKSGTARKVSGKRPGWLLEKAICEEAQKCSSVKALVEALEHREEFISAKQDGQKKINSLKQKYGTVDWKAARSQILEDDRRQLAQLVASASSLDKLCESLGDLPVNQINEVRKLQQKWRKRFAKTNWSESQRQLLAENLPRWETSKAKAEAKRRLSEQQGSIAGYKRLLDAHCLPLPGFAEIDQAANLTVGAVKLRQAGGEWKRAMWNLAGQRIRSHLGWVRRRTNERVVWELQSALFDRGGWLRIKRDGKPIKKETLTASDFLIEGDSPSDATDFELCPAFGMRKWLTTLRNEYELVEMSVHLSRVSFGAAEQPRILRRTIKGWSKIREKWTEIMSKAAIADAAPPSAQELIEIVNRMRARKSRDFGDQRLFEWLAALERRWLWDGSDHGDNNDCGRDDRDCVTAFVSHNEHLADKPDSITFTRSDAVKHPVWPFFGENSAVEYWLSKETTQNGKSRLVLVLKQLLSRQSDRSYSAVENVKIALRGYEDFERSFELPGGQARVSAKEQLVFHDDLLGGKTRQGTLSGIKLTWERNELEATKQKHHSRKVAPRVYANFSCDAGLSSLADWLKKHVGSDVKLTKPRDGMTRVFFLKKAITKASADDEFAPGLRPGERNWPKEAIEKGFAVRGTDLGYRVSSAGAWWRLSFSKPDGMVAWPVGKCEGKEVYALLEHTATVSLPGDGETLPAEEQALQECVKKLRTRLNLNNVLLRIVRLLMLESVTRRTKHKDKIRKRKDGTEKRVGTIWKSENITLPPDESRENCRKAGELLVNWSERDTMRESLNDIGHDAPLWDWLVTQDPGLSRLRDSLPKTIVPTIEEAKARDADREVCKQKRNKEDEEFADTVYDLRASLARALFAGNDSNDGRAADSLWVLFDRVLRQKLSYSERQPGSRERTHFGDGLFRRLRKPPVTKHHDRKDEANNLPHGKTYRGGLSMARLNFLDDVKNFVRRWTCRPRQPGEIRRVPEDAKFDRCDTEHLDHLREHRAKLIAHADVAQTLGFEQDLRRGVWRFRHQPSGELLWHRPERAHFYREIADNLIQCDTPNGIHQIEAKHPHPAFEPAHVLAYEDLKRYRMSSDRPKNENAGLARWSHRRILSFAQHIGGLFGVPVATVDARFSSRFCSHCGAPGCRAD
ncbi:MAG: type V CRISPR-associated protein Cas12b, partial [Gemmataceae bacterium]|nr:type V CRISPR-associated protein Cas12b [Gemmataceae bacterium]